MNFTKLLHPKTCIRLLVADKDHRIRGYYVVPKNGTVTLKDRVFTIDNSAPVMMSGRQPCYMFINDIVKPINLYTLQKDETTPEELKDILSSRFMKDIARVSMGNPKSSMIYVVIGLVVLLGGFYLLYTKIQEQADALTALRDLLTATLGG